MLIVIGGPTRSGKGVVSRTIAATLGWPMLSLDVLKMGLSVAVPSLGIDPGAPSEEVGRAMWPVLDAIFANALETGTDYIVEGDMIFPHQVEALRATAGDQIVACFLGYRRAAPERKLADIRRFSGLPNDWLRGQEDAAVLALVRDGIEASERLAAECERLGLRYFDDSSGFVAMVDDAVDYLASRSGRRAS